MDDAVNWLLNLTPLEKRLVACAGAGQRLDCAPHGGSTGDDLDIIDDWDARIIRADVLVALCAGDRSDWTVPPRRGVSLTGANVVGELDLSRATLIGRPLDFTRCRFAEGIKLDGAQVGRLRLRSCVIRRLSADELESAASLSLVGSRMGSLILTDARIKHVLNCTHATITNRNGPALSGDRLSAATVSFSNATIIGEVRLVEAQISGQLDCTDATITSGASPVKAKIGDQLDCTDATITEEAPPVFFGDRLAAAGVSLRRARITGKLSLAGAKIDGQLDCNYATLINKNGPAFFARGMHVGRELLFRLGRPAVGEVDFSDADVGPLVDDLNCWPSHVRLVGFTYRSLELKEPDPDQRLGWIRRSEPFSPAPYTQLQSVYQRFGHDRDARTVAIAREHDRRKRGDLGRESTALNWFLEKTVAYGYRPQQALWYLLFFVALATVLFLLPAGKNAMAPTDTASQAKASTCTPSYPCFSSLIYALDVLLPVIDFHQESNWLPAPTRPYGSWYLGFTWALIAIGWLLTTSVIAGIGSVWRRE